MKRRVSEALLRHEVALIHDLLDSAHIEVEADYANLCLTTDVEARDGEQYRISFECSNYDQAPPYMEAVDLDTGERDTPDALFDDRGAQQDPSADEKPLLYHGGPAICHAFNRKMYLYFGQVHDDWNPSSISQWQSLAAPHNTLAEIHELIYRRLRSDHYNGRFNDTQ